MTEKVWKLLERHETCITYRGYKKYHGKTYTMDIDIVRYAHPECKTTIDGITTYYPARQDNHVQVIKGLYEDQEPSLYPFKESFLEMTDAEKAAIGWMNQNGGVA
jgi:hypothetical protein